MTEHPQGTLDGFAAAKEGAERALAHADQVDPNWRDAARGFMNGFILTVPYFTSEDVWVAAEAAGVPKPPDRRSWGGVIRGFEARKLIRRVGTGYSKIARLHGNHITVYERA